MLQLASWLAHPAKESCERVVTVLRVGATLRGFENHFCRASSKTHAQNNTRARAHGHTHAHTTHTRTHARTYIQTHTHTAHKHTHYTLHYIIHIQTPTHILHTRAHTHTHTHTVTHTHTRTITLPRLAVYYRKKPAEDGISQVEKRRGTILVRPTRNSCCEDSTLYVDCGHFQ